MIKNIIFDIGRVLVDYDWETYLDGYGFEREKREALADAMFRGMGWRELDRGALPLEELMELFISHAPRYREDILTVFDGAHRCIAGRTYAVPWIRSLKEQEKNVYFLSNYSELMVNRTREALNFLPLMDGGLFSYEVHQIKPEPEIYRSFLARYPALRPEESVFLDDSAENIAAARAFGIDGIVFVSPEQAMAELEARLR